MDNYQIGLCPKGCKTRAFLEPGGRCSLCDTPMEFETLAQFAERVGAEG